MSTEQSNRIILLLFGALVLLVFMDAQARRHYRSLTEERAELPEISSPAVRSVPSRVQETVPSLPSAPVLKASAESILGGEMDRFPSATDRKERTNLKNVGEEEPGWKALDDSIGAGHESDPGAKTTPPPDTIGLYYIRFASGRSRLVRVHRKYDLDHMDYRHVLDLLQKGPEPRERGLLNAFDARIPIRSVSVENKIATINLGEAVGRMGRSIVRDRLDQMVLTLTQFPEIRGVSLRVEGKVIREIGSAHIPVPSVLRAPARPVEDFQD